METIEISKHCRISYLPTVPCIHIQWFGVPPSEDFRKGCDTVLEIMSHKSVSKILTDNTEAKLFSVADQKWLNESWLPRAEKAGYRVSATLLGEDAFVKFAAQNIASKRDQTKFKSKFFKNMEEAIDWLKTV